uniref:hypothetical protein n=1 Tax=Stieleria mannarensis TaxID=2755585 RepID=UPI001C7267E0
EKLMRKNRELDLEAYALQTARTRGISDSATKLYDEAVRLLDSFTGDERKFMHGHDFVTHLRISFLNARISPQLVRTDEILSKLLFASLEREFLETYPLFQNLRSRLA